MADLSAGMLADAGASHVVFGQSECRAGHGEADVCMSAEAARAATLVAVICVGETEAGRGAGRTSR